MGNTRQITAEAGEELSWILAQELSKVSPFLNIGVVGARFMRKQYTAASASLDVPHNPRFVANGHDGASRVTLAYLRSRAIKNVTSATLEGESTLAAMVIQVDVVGTGKAANALGSTVVHMLQLKAIGAAYRQSETITGWIEVVLRAKALKAGIRSADLAGAAIPIGALGLGMSVATAITKAGVQLTMGTLITRVAMELHWRAFAETAMSPIPARGKPVGPASAILYELFRKRGVTRMFGQYDVASL
jgi:hypothetical protein